MKLQCVYTILRFFSYYNFSSVFQFCHSVFLFCHSIFLFCHSVLLFCHTTFENICLYNFYMYSRNIISCSDLINQVKLRSQSSLKFKKPELFKQTKTNPNSLQAIFFTKTNGLANKKLFPDIDYHWFYFYFNIWSTYCFSRKYNYK